jgi:N6-adenosine-specific RNA methylase IME4
VTRFVTMTADPSWAYKDQLTMKGGEVKRSSESQYPTMTVEDICALGSHGTVAGFETMPDAFLWLWVTNPILIDGTGARVARAWGFRPVQLVTWVKGRIADEQLIAQIGMGHFTRGATEHLLLCTRGKAKKLLKNKATPNVFIAPRTSHSTKPEEAYRLIEQLTPGPYVELFARRVRPNWIGWGLDYPTEATA